MFRVIKWKSTFKSRVLYRWNYALLWNPNSVIMKLSKSEWSNAIIQKRMKTGEHSLLHLPLDATSGKSLHSTHVGHFFKKGHWPKLSPIEHPTDLLTDRKSKERNKKRQEAASDIQDWPATRGWLLTALNEIQFELLFVWLILAVSRSPPLVRWET